MSRWQQVFEDGMRTGTVAGAATTLAVAGCGEWENRNAIAPLNAVSHIAWGEKAANQTEPSWKYTATGFVLNAVAIIGWATIYEWLFGRAAAKGNVAAAVAGGAAVSAIAYVTDYHVVPQRFTPGFEKRLSNSSLAAVYGALALGLAFGSLCGRSRK
jgi:predicted permease